MANFNFNKVMLGGRLTADPELRQTQSGISNVRFSIAVNRRFQRQDQNADPNAPQKSDADFFNVVAWRQTAEFVARYFRKGSSIFVVGSVQNNNWTDQQGVKRYSTEIVADEIQFVDSLAESQRQSQQNYGGSSFGGAAYQSPAAAGQASGYTPDSYAPSQSAPPAQFETVEDDTGLPF